MRDGCYHCVMKHLGAASVLMDEAMLGYPLHKWLAVGHMVEAEAEMLQFDSAMAMMIRDARLRYINGGPGNEIITLLAQVERMMRDDTSETDD